MRGNDKVHKDLSEALKAELTAINQYFLHGKMCDNWGYFRLGAHYRKESIEEMVHAEKLLEGQLHAIDEIGIENYLAQQLHKGDKEDN